jgi:uncharacterized membrane protein
VTAAAGLAPIEIVTIAFPGNQFNGRILPELEALVAEESITIVDGVFVSVDTDGDISYAEFDELGGNEAAASVGRLVQSLDDLISDDDVAELASDLEPNSSAVILVFEHTWVKPLRDAVVGSQGVLLESVRVPGAVVDEVLAAVSESR